MGSTYQVGEKVVGYWGAMWPYSYGKMIDVDYDTMKFVVEWSDGSTYQGHIGDVYYENAKARAHYCGVGVYFAQGYENEEWFENA